jgi:hypothetical protein
MSDRTAHDEPIETLLDWHADLLANGQPERAAALASRSASVPEQASLFALAARVGETLAPVAPDAGFRHNLRAQLLGAVVASPPAEAATRRRPRRYVVPVARMVARWLSRPVAWVRRWTGRPAPRRLGSGRLVGTLRSLMAVALIGFAAVWWWTRLMHRAVGVLGNGTSLTASVSSARAVPSTGHR